MAGRLMNNQKLSPIGLIKDEMNMSYMLGQKSSLDLMQNCDLPPPLKVFSCPDKTLLSPSNNNEAIDESTQELGSDRLELLKALRRSQTRAREAERKCQALHKENDALSNLLIEESVRLLAYKNWIKVLELQILQLQTQQEHVDRWHTIKEDDDKHSANGVSWFMAVAFCLGIAAIGCRYLL